jgi:hypothetical protein
MTHSTVIVAMGNRRSREAPIAIEDLVEPGEADHVRAAEGATAAACTINTVEPA